MPGPAAIAHRPARLAWEQTGLPLVAGQVKAEVVHSPHYTMPLRVGRPVVVTVHDATFFTQPEVHTAVKGTFFRSATRTALRRATRVIVPSKATRDELIRVLDADPTMIDVAYHGVDTELFHPPTEAERDRVTARLGLHGQGYVAFLGTLEPRKNVPGADPRLGRGGQATARRRPRWCSPAAAAGTTTSTPPSPRCRRHLRVVRPGYLRFGDLPGYLGARPGRRLSRPTARASACRCSRRWPAGCPC